MLSNAFLLSGEALAITAYASNDADPLTAELWSPIEISLQSSVAYDNPYTDTEINAVFTHTDGTSITLPGFWKEDSTWCVRFSPIKIGKWKYEITCTDTTNSGLFSSGMIQAVESTKDTEIAKHGFVTLEKDQRYFKYADGTPFFWLGDTNWQVFTNASTTICNYPGCSCGNQFQHIVDNRVEKGFTVYQTYFVPEGGNGEPSLWLDAAYEMPNLEVFNNKVDAMFSYLGEQGLVIALGLGCHSFTPNKMNLDAFQRFARYIVARYAAYPVVWITGQEITVSTLTLTEGYNTFEFYLEIASLVEELDGYHHPNSAHMWPLYAEERFPVLLDKTDWHDYWLLQGGHGNIMPQKFYKGYYNNSSGTVKPVIESESHYEDIFCGKFTGYDTNRISAWKALLCGCAGFTYGATGIWANCFSTDTFTGWYGRNSYSYEPWYMGLNKPGSFEMTYLKNFFIAIGPWEQLIPSFSSKDDAEFFSRERSVLSKTSDASVIVTYFYDSPGRNTGEYKCLNPEKYYDTYWYNPRTGKFIALEENVNSPDGIYTIPEKPTGNDWVFLMTSIGLGEHYEEPVFVDLNPDNEHVAPTGQEVSPKNVTAVGGITYHGPEKASQTMTDHTAWLYDGDPTTIWMPSAHRPSQTLLFDLGTPQDLTHLSMLPAPGTILPCFRVEGSNDAQNWSIITDTSMRSTLNYDSVSEPLAGVYRYVKILLLNPTTVNVGEFQLDTLPYEAEYSWQTANSYSVTKIADIAIYSNGEGVPEEEILIPSTLPVQENASDNVPYSLIFSLIAIICIVVVGSCVVVFIKRKLIKTH